MYGNHSVNIRKYNKKDKKRKWVIEPRKQQEDNFFISHNLLIKSSEYEKSKSYREEIISLIKRNEVASINFNLKNGIMDKKKLYDIRVRTLLNPEYTNGRCHGCVFAMGLCVDNFTWVYGNINTIAMGNLNYYEINQNEYVLAEFYKESRNYNEVKPVYNHSFMIIDGSELLAQDIVCPMDLMQGFKIDTKSKYVIDPRFDWIMKQEIYDKILQPEYFETYKKSEFEKTKIWQIMEQQSCKPNKYDYEEFRVLYKQIQEATGCGVERLICEMLLADVHNLAPYKNNNLDYFLCKIEDDDFSEDNTKSIIQDNRVLQK